MTDSAVPANTAGSGNVAGVTGDPPVNNKPRKKKLRQIAPIKTPVIGPNIVRPVRN